MAGRSPQRPRDCWVATAERQPHGGFSSVTGPGRLGAELGPILNLSGDFLRNRARVGCGRFRATVAGRLRGAGRARRQDLRKPACKRGYEQCRAAQSPENSVRIGRPPPSSRLSRPPRAMNLQSPVPDSLLRHRPFVLYWNARISASIAFQMVGVAVGWQMYSITGSALDLGLVGLAQFLPATVLMLVAGQLADRYDRRLILQICQTIEGLAVAA